MKITVYGDVLFIINFVINYRLLSLSSRLTRKKISIYRLILASALAALIYLLTVILDFGCYIFKISPVLCSAAAVLISFKPSDIKGFAADMIVLNILMLLTGGMAMLISYYMPELPFILLMGAALLIIEPVVYIYNCLYRIKNGYHSLRIELDGKSANMEAILDTGNMLIEPISKKSVILAEYEAVSELLPMSLVELFNNKKESCLMEIVELLGDEALRLGIRVVPYRAVGKKSGLLLGFCADRIEIDGVEIEPVVIGIYSGGFGQDYRALIASEHIL